MKNFKKLILTSFLFLSFEFIAQDARALDDYDIVIVAGQSNSVGWGVGTNAENGNLDPIFDDYKTFSIYRGDVNNSPNSNIQQLKLDGPPQPSGSTAPSSSSIAPAVSGTIGIDSLAGRISKFGFQVSFAREYLRSIPRSLRNAKVLLIGCGWQSTGVVGDMSEVTTPRLFWYGGKPSDGPSWWNKSSSGNYYDVKNLVSRCQDRIEDAVSLVGSNSKVVAILWHQGEYNMVNTSVLSSNSTRTNYVNSVSYLLNAIRLYARTKFRSSVANGTDLDVSI